MVVYEIEFVNMKSAAKIIGVGMTIIPCVMDHEKELVIFSPSMKLKIQLSEKLHLTPAVMLYALLAGHPGQYRR